MSEESTNYAMAQRAIEDIDSTAPRSAFLVTYECGCVGARPNHENKSLTFWHCDGGAEDSSYHVPGYRDVAGKRFHESPFGLEEQLTRNLARRVGDGYSLAEIRGLLKEPEATHGG